MLLIRTRVGPSAIHGVGVFASEAIPAGAQIWRFEPSLDRVIDEVELQQMPEAFREFLAMYAYRSIELDGQMVLPCDHSRFLNHSDDPNTEERPLLSVASRAILVGDEITCDYRAFCTDGKAFD